MPSAGGGAVSVQPEATTGSGEIPHRAATIGDDNDPPAWCALSCTTRSLLCSAGEIIVLQVKGEVDLGTLPILQAALGDSLDRHPPHLIVDLARMTFCSAGGLDLLTQTRYTTAEKATSYAVSSVPPRIDRIWALVWDGDLPVHHRSTAAAMTATIQAGE
jgi:anti-sigma B factor antagonist